MSKVAMKMNQILMAVMSRLMPSCVIITHKISESMDGKISLWDKFKIHIHLLGCKLCTRYRDQLLAIQYMLNKYTENVEHEQILTDGSLSEAARERIRRNLGQKKNN